MSSTLTRITVIGKHRHLDLRVPSDEPLASLVPRIRELIIAGTEEQGHRATPTVLTTAVGDVLDGAQTLSAATVKDGARLYLREEGAVPPAPEVYDVASFAAEATDSSPGLWSGPLRSGGLAAVAAILLAGSAGASVLMQGPDGGPTGILLAAGMMVVGAAYGRFRSAAVGLPPVVAGWLVAVAGAFAAPYFPPAATILAATVTALVAAGVACRMHVSFFTPASLLAGLGCLWGLVRALTGHDALAAGITGIAAVLVLGLGPRLATIVAGLDRLDDEQRQGGPPSERRSVLEAFHCAHRTLSGYSILAAAVISAAAVVVCLERDRPVWALLLASSLLGALVFRGFPLPLYLQRAAVYVLAGAGLCAAAVVLAAQLHLTAILAVPAVVGALIFAAAGASVRQQTGARLRLLAQRAEAVCVLATIPLALGLSGAYEELGRAFG